MAERRQRAAFEQLHARAEVGPVLVALPGELGAPTEPAGDRHQPFLESAAQTFFGADPAGDDDLATRPHHPHELVECRLRARDRRHDILRNDDVKGGVGILQLFGVHHGDAVDVGQAVALHAQPGFLKHRLGDVDADEPVAPRVARQRQPGADTDLQDAPADAIGRSHRSQPAPPENRTEDQVVDRRPSTVGTGDLFLPHGGVHRGSLPHSGIDVTNLYRRCLARMPEAAVLQF